MSAIKADNPELAKMGIEFWTTIADEEVELQFELEDAQANGTTPNRSSCYYTQGALEALLPELLECLAKQVRRTPLHSVLYSLCSSAARLLKIHTFSRTRTRTKTSGQSARQLPSVWTLLLSAAVTVRSRYGGGGCMRCTKLVVGRQEVRMVLLSSCLLFPIFFFA